MLYYTYEITFTRLDGQPDETQQYTDEGFARECFRLFDEPDSAEMYSRIRLTRHDWETGTDEVLDMSNETWMNAKKAVELGFADEILFSKKEDEPDSDPANPDKPEKTPDEEPGEGEEKKPFQQDTAGHLFSSRQMDLIVLNRLGVKPDTPAAQTEPPSDLPAEAGPVLDMDGKTEEGDYSYNVLMKQLECMK